MKTYSQVRTLFFTLSTTLMVIGVSGNFVLQPNKLEGRLTEKLSIPPTSIYHTLDQSYLSIIKSATPSAEAGQSGQLAS